MNGPATGIRSLRERGARPSVDVRKAIAEALSLAVIFWHDRMLEIERILDGETMKMGRAVFITFQLTAFRAFTPADRA